MAKSKSGLVTKPGKFQGGPGRVLKAHKNVTKKSGMHDARESKGKRAVKKTTPAAGKIVGGHNAIAR